MKKIIFLFGLILSLVLVSCSEDDNRLYTLKGKTFAAFYYIGTGAGGIHYNVYNVWKFISDSEVEWTTRGGSPTGDLEGVPSMGTYTLNYPDLEVQFITETSSVRFTCNVINGTILRFGDNAQSELLPGDFALQ